MSGAIDRIDLLVSRTDEGMIELSSPEVGEIMGVLERGATLSPGMVAATLLRLGRSYALLAPQGASGLVVSEPPLALRAPVGCGDIIFTLDPAGTVSQDAIISEEHDGTDGSALVVRATQPGRVWLRPSPSEPPLAPLGQDVEDGTALCLIEVMKTFSTVPYRPEGPLPQRAKVKRWLVEDGADVEPGTPLVVVEPH